MPKIDIPNEKERQVMERNGLNPTQFCVTYRDETTICLRNYKTRDDLTIHQGDKVWGKG